LTQGVSSATYIGQRTKADVREKILAAVEKVHVAYQQTERLFD